MSATVSITIVGRTYEISCDDGQEDYLRSLSVDIDRRAADLLRSVGQVGDARLLVMVALMMADEMLELRDAKTADPLPGALDSDLALGIDGLAHRIDAIADRLYKA